jgi:hypothetical protein
MRSNFRKFMLILVILTGFVMIPAQTTWAGSDFQTIPTRPPMTATLSVSPTIPSTVDPPSTSTPTIPPSKATAMSFTATALKATQLSASYTATNTPTSTKMIPPTTTSTATATPVSTTPVPPPDPGNVFPGLWMWMIGFIVLIAIVFGIIRYSRPQKK